VRIVSEQTPRGLHGGGIAHVWQPLSQPTSRLRDQNLGELRRPHGSDCWVRYESKQSNNSGQNGGTNVRTTDKGNRLLTPGRLKRLTLLPKWDLRIAKGFQLFCNEKLTKLGRSFLYDAEIVAGSPENFEKEPQEFPYREQAPCKSESRVNGYCEHSVLITVSSRTI